ncbi:MAG: hypothetical protein AAGG01_15225 [Planctomycetota bacterium]
MITPLRRRHRWMAPAFLLAGGATLLGAGWLSKPAPIDAAGPGPEPRGSAVAPQLPGDASVVEHPSGRFRVAVEGAGEGARPRRLWLLPSEALDIPDLIVYGAPKPSDVSALEGESLPSSAVLLGPASGSQPASWDLESNPETLLLFSLAHQSVAAAIEVPR